MGIHTLNLRDGSQVEVEAPKDTPLAELIKLAQNKTAEARTKEIDAELDARLLVNPIEQAGGPPDKKTAFGRGIARGVDSLQQNLGSAVEGIGSVLGLEGVEEYGANVALDNEHQLQRAERFSTRLDDVGGISSGASYVGEIGGESAPQMAQVAAGAAIGATVGSAVPIIGTGVGAIVGGALAAFPLFYGSNRERQKDAIDRGLKTEISEGAAALTAIPQAALDSILTTIGAKFLLKPGAEIGGGLLTRATKGAKVGVITEVPTEIGQAVLERAQAGLPLSDAEALREYGEAGLAAGILGGGIGGVAGAAKGSSSVEADADAEVLSIEDMRDKRITDQRQGLGSLQIEDQRVSQARAAIGEALDTDGAVSLEKMQSIVTDSGIPFAELEGVVAEEMGKRGNALAQRAKAQLDEEKELKSRLQIEGPESLGLTSDNAGNILTRDQRNVKAEAGRVETKEVENARMEALKNEALPKTDDSIDKTKAKVKSQYQINPLVEFDVKKDLAGQAKQLDAPQLKGGVNEQATETKPDASRDSVQPLSKNVVRADDIDPAGDADAKKGARKSKASTDGGLGSTSVVSGLPDGTKRTKPTTLEDTPEANFTTAKGSTYELYSDGTTKRDRAARNDNEGSGVQPRSGKTVYMTYEEAAKIGGLFQNEEMPVQLIPMKGNKAKLIHLKPYGKGVNQKKAGSDASEVASFELQPRVGLLPVEILDSTNTSRRNIHFGNKITKINKTKAKPKAKPEAKSADVRKVMPILGKKGTGFAPEGKAKDVEAKPKQTTVKQRAESAKSQKEKVAARKSESKELNAKQAAVYARKPANVQRMGKDLDAEVTIDEFDNTAKKAVLSEMDKTRTKGTPVTNAIQRYFGQFPTFDSALAQAIEDVASGETRTADSNDLSGNLPQQVMQREFYLADPSNNLPSMGKVSAAKVLKWFGVDVTKSGAVKVLPDGKGSKNLKSYIETELNSAITAYANINNRQKAYTKQQEQQRRNLKAEKIAAEVERDNAINKVFKLPAELVIDLPLRPQVRKALLAGKLQDALVALQATAGSRATSKLAKTFAENVGNTKLIIKKNLKTDDGSTKLAGYFDPETNTIALDAETGINTHALLHEMFHAVTSATIANKSHPLTKKLTKIFEGVKEQLAGEYGLTSLDEFVAEYQANPEFSNQLKTTTVNGRNPWMQLIRALANFVRTKMGIATVPETSTFDAVDKLVQEIIAPTYDGRAATKIYMEASTPTGAAKLVNGLGAPNVAKVTTKKDFYDYVQEGKSWMISKTPNKAKDVWLKLQPVNILGALAESSIPGTTGLNTIINNMSSSLRRRNASLDPVVNKLRNYRKREAKKFLVLQSMVPTATYNRIDPREADFNKAYGYKDGDEAYDIKRAKTVHAELRRQYKALGKEGQDLYKTVTNTFEFALRDIMDSVDARLNATVKDPQLQKKARDKIAELLNMERGVIKPFAPLIRVGNYRLQYTSVDPTTGNPEMFVEYFRTIRAREKAKKNLKEYNDAWIAKNPNNKKVRTQIEMPWVEGTKDSVFDYSKAPSGSFIYNVLKTLESQGIDKATQQLIVDLALDSMPERSFMQGLRNRKNIRGFLGDVTPTGIAETSFDLVDTVESKGRDYNRQLVQMEFGAKLETFKRDVLDPVEGKTMDDTTKLYKDNLSRIVNFAQRPNVPRWSQTLTAGGYAWTMGWNLSSAAITTFDVFMSTAPRLMGKYGDKATFKAMGKAASILAQSPKTKMVAVMQPDGTMAKEKVNTGKAGFSIGNYDYTDPNLSSELKDIEVLADIAEDSAQINQSLNQEELDMGNAKDVVEKINSWTSFLFHHAERYNREVAMTSTYMLELARLRANNAGKPLSLSQKQDAARMAVSETEFTLGATASAGRPVMAQSGLGNVAMLFKRFAISKYHMMATMTNDAFQAGGDAQTKENRRIAQGQLGRFFVTTGLFAGLAGMPLMGAIGALYDLFVDDDEDDFDAVLRKSVGEGLYKGLINTALGVDVASRIGLNSLLYRPPIIDKDQATLWTLLEQLGGPVVGIYLSAERGIDLIGEGDVLKGVEAMAPAAVRNVIKGGKQLATGEVTTRRGNAVVEDIGIAQVLGQFAGFANADLIKQYEINKNERRKSGYLSKKRTKLLRQANIAAANNDREAYKSALKAIREYNKGLSRAARSKNIILSDTIKKSRRAFDTRTGKMIGGIEYTPMMRDSLKEYDQGVQLFK